MVNFMAHEIDLSKYKLRTDLAIESIKEDIEGVKLTVSKEDNIKITDCYVNKVGSSKINKKSGNYITIEFEDITDHENSKKIENVFVIELKKMLNKLRINLDSKCLVIGLGNNKATPDALGPLVISDIFPALSTALTSL